MNRLLLHLLVAIGLGGPLAVPLPVAAQGPPQTATMEVIPPDPTDHDEITLRCAGTGGTRVCRETLACRSQTT